MLQFEEILDNLSHTHPIFHDENDFCNALIEALMDSYPDCRVYSECSPQPYDRNERLDLCMTLDGEEHLVELKYKTNRFETQLHGETYYVGKNPVDLACYDYLKDIERLERVVNSRNGSVGYAIIISNKSLLWRGPPKKGAQYYPFRVEEGRRIQGEMDWTANRERKGKSRRNPIVLENSYPIRWADYSDLSANGTPSKNGIFRYLILPVT